MRKCFKLESFLKLDTLRGDCRFQIIEFRRLILAVRMDAARGVKLMAFGRRKFWVMAADLGRKFS